MEIENTTNCSSATIITSTPNSTNTYGNKGMNKKYNSKNSSYYSKDHMKELLTIIENNSSSSRSSSRSSSSILSLSTIYYNFSNYINTSVMKRSSIFIEHPTLLEWWFWIARFMVIITIIYGLIGILYHDYD